jgi:Fic family protein
MNLSNYKSGGYQQGYDYKYFVPSKINQTWILSDPQIQHLLGEADRALGALSAYSEAVPDIDYFIRMHISKEATQSSRIEGTNTTMEDVFLEEQDIDPEKRDDRTEVLNYISAINDSIFSMDEYPLCNRLLKDAHKTLMQGVRGQSKLPGEFRISQNWIGVSLKNAIFVPPHQSLVVDLMSDLEIFLNNESSAPHLLKIAIAHYQFETIHPFLDGNGRLGRLMISLYLSSFKLLHKPALYLSDYFERNKTEYVYRMMAVRLSNDMKEWLVFFLHGVLETAQNSIQVLKDVVALKSRLEATFLPVFSPRRQEGAQALMRHLYQTPVVTVKGVAELLDIQSNTAAALIRDFEKHGVLTLLSSKKRNRSYGFTEYMSLFKKQAQVEPSNQVDNNQVDDNQVDNNQVDDNQVDDNQVDNNQVGNNQVDNNQVGNNQVDDNQVDNNQVDNNQVDNNQVDNNQVDNNQVDNSVKKLVSIFSGELSRVEIKSLLNLTDGEYARQQYIAPSLKQGYIEMTLSDKPTSKLQKYRLTAKGVSLQEYLTK